MGSAASRGVAAAAVACAVCEQVGRAGERAIRIDLPLHINACSLTLRRCSSFRAFFFLPHLRKPGRCVRVCVCAWGE